MSDLAALRRFYAEELRAVSDIRSEALVRRVAPSLFESQTPLPDPLPAAGG